MKKSWIPIIICLLFILGWEAFVVRPAMKKDLEARKHQQTKAEVTPSKVLPGSSVATAATDGKAIAEGAAKLASIATIPEGKFERIELSSQRTMELSPRGNLGAITFADYKVRGKIEDNVILLADKMRWSSTDPNVQDCFNKIQRVTTLKFAHAEGSRKCEIEYVSDPQRVGLLRAKLLLSGFPESQGVVEFRGVDGVGTGSPENAHLSFKIDDSKKDVRGKDLLHPDAADGLRKGRIDWLAWGDKYFVALLIPSKEAGTFNPNVVYGAAREDGNKTSFGFQYPILNKEGRSVDVAFQLYFGTRDAEELKAIDPILVEAVDLGFFAAVARAMLWALKSLYKIFHNYGLAIIVLTLIVRVLFWPLNRKVFVAGQKMKELQPQIEKLKAKYGKDRSQADQMNRELLGLYRTQKVNPLGSCLPLLAQMPIFLGLYGALNHSLDLYQAPFIGWVKDLSSPDPFYVFPILWTVTLLIYTKLTPMTPPQTGDGQAAPDMTKVMLVMNLVFGFLAKDWPAGLTLYLFVSNLVGITQQLMFKRAAKLQPIQEGA